MDFIPWPWRIGLLLGILAVAALVDLYRHRARAGRWRDHLFILGGGALGAAFGGLNDYFVSSALSPEYFEWGKGLAGGDGLRLRAAWLGVQAGTAPGMIAATILLFAGRRPAAVPALSRGKILTFLGWPLLAAALAGAVFSLIFSSHDPVGFRPVLGRVLAPERIDRFLRVWWLHVGLYAGFLAGLACGIAGVARRRPGSL